MNAAALVVGLVPCAVWCCSAIAYVIATEHGDDLPTPLVYRGDAENEPWGHPHNTSGRTYRFPGDRVRRTNRALQNDDTAHIARIEDERT